MKTKEEAAALNIKPAELSDEELAQIADGEKSREDTNCEKNAHNSQDYSAGGNR